ncbi:PEP-CTERM sorting domain-containing protein [Colwellia sp. C1TZA3]|uniref:PEP-CTERM sorting domain-containing protein n=1 Tax=Colwellia sp. C1TZA3 TaxID=2508879 RepID=UPI001CB920B0|nr:PEP-CTERM sorting domain-containing protein [Colwellia sp. C1TZA3]
MKSKLFKASFLSLLLTVSNYTNASLIFFEFNSTDSTLTYEWTIESSQPVFNIDWGIYYLAEIITTINGISTTQEGSFGALNIGDDVLSSGPPGTRVSNGGFELFEHFPNGDIRGFFVAEGPVLFSSRIMGNAMFMGGSASFIDGQFDLIQDTNPNLPSFVDTQNGTLNIKVPEPSTLAIFALGLMGLVSRRFKKQS